MSDKKESITGYPYTHCDCPGCMGEIIVEGDARGEEVECDNCGEKYIVE